MGTDGAVEKSRVVDGKGVLAAWSKVIERAMIDVTRSNKNFEEEAIAALGWLVTGRPPEDRLDRFASYLNACDITGRDWRSDLLAVGRRMAKSPSFRTRRRAEAIARRLGITVEELKRRR